MIRTMLLASVFVSAFVGQAVGQPKIEEQDGLGIKLEELLSDKGSFRLEFGTTFSASRREGVSALYQTIKTGTGQFVTVPVDVGTTDRQSGVLLANLGLRYGLTAKAEVYSRAALRWDNSHLSDNATGVTRSESDRSLQSLIVGINYRLIDEDANPGVIGFADVALFENIAARGTELRSGKSGTVGFTAYRVLDPVVLSLTAGYRANLERTVGTDRINPGDSIFINPNVAFAVNNELTLTGGFGINYVGADRVNGVSRDNRSLGADLQFGLAYAWDDMITLQADTSAEVLDGNNLTIDLSLTRKLWKARQQRNKSK